MHGKSHVSIYSVKALSLYGNEHVELLQLLRIYTTTRKRTHICATFISIILVVPVTRPAKSKGGTASGISIK